MQKPQLPWRIEETASAYRIADDLGRSIAYVYFREGDNAMLKAAEVLSKSEALETAELIVSKVNKGEH